MRCTSLLLVLLMLGACGTDPPGEEALFPADYATTYQEVRNCRRSLDHDTQFVRMLASPDAFEAYDGRMIPFAAGGMIIKEQYADDDTSCEGPIEVLTVMKKLEAGADPEMLDWEWQRTDAKRKVDTEYDTKRCTRCHEDCGGPPFGYAGTCAAP